MPLLINIFSAVAIHVVITRFETDKDGLDALMSPRKKARAGDPAPSKSPWDILYADDAVVISELFEQLRKMKVVILAMSAAFGPTVSEKD